MNKFYICKKNFYVKNRIKHQIIEILLFKKGDIVNIKNNIIYLSDNIEVLKNNKYFNFINNSYIIDDHILNDHFMLKRIIDINNILNKIENK